MGLKHIDNKEFYYVDWDKKVIVAVRVTAKIRSEYLFSSDQQIVYGKAGRNYLIKSAKTYDPGLFPTIESAVKYLKDRLETEMANDQLVLKDLLIVFLLGVSSSPN